MRILAGVLLPLMVSARLGQQPVQVAQTGQKAEPDPVSEQQPLQRFFAGKIKTEWDAFKNKDKKAYSDLLAEDFTGIEDDGQGVRNKTAGANEINSSVVNDYSLFAFNVLPLNPDAALVTYELTVMFPPKAQVRFKRVLVSEIWLKRESQWKLRYYQETRVR
jgi:hypothetical protein